MCEHCGLTGPCIVCGRTGDNQADAAAQLREAERRLAESRAETERLEKRAAELRRAAGRRPGDGSDQLRIFDASHTPNIFDII